MFVKIILVDQLSCKKMKKGILLLLSIFTLLSQLFAQEEICNRYAMKLTREADGSFSLVNRARYASRINLDEVKDLLVPYIYKEEKLHSSDFSGIVSKEFIYKSYPGYDLKLMVDYAVSDKPAPFIIYIHGGGWARGDYNANKDLSLYCAKNAGITGVRITYSLAGKPGVDIMVTISDVLDAVKWVRQHAKELNIDPAVFGFMGGSAGAHLSAVAAMMLPETKLLIGVSGIYNLSSAAISSEATDPQRIAYFRNKDPETLRKASPAALIHGGKLPATLLIHGTGDITVECRQSILYAEKLSEAGLKNLKLELFPWYDHNINSKKSDLRESLIFEMYNFIVNNLK
jgi:acetyl esterase/lipase